MSAKFYFNLYILICILLIYLLYLYSTDTIFCLYRRNSIKPLYKLNYGDLNMKHLVDQSTGVIVLTPECDADRKILYHLINCSDLSQFSEYLEYQQKIDPAEITTDLGVPANRCHYYMSEPVDRLPEQTEKAIQPGRLIGFNRESYSTAGF